MTLALHYALRSDVGLLRPGNEDSAYAGPNLLVIADGMGGHAAGEVASAVAVSALAPLDHQGLRDGAQMLRALGNAVDAASSTLHEMSVADPSVEGMGTTVTALLWAGAQVALCHIGDSRAYLLRDVDFSQITRDHTLVQSLVDEGRLTPEAAATHPQRSLVMRALQGNSDAEPDLIMREAMLGDRYLLCSDGLSDVVTEQTLHKAMGAFADPEQVVLHLIDLAIRAGGPDNITCIVADVVDTETGPVPPSEASVLAGAAASNEGRPRLLSDSPAGRAHLLTQEPQHANGRAATATHARPYEPDVDDAGDDEDAAEADPGRRHWPLVTSILVVLILLIAGGGFAAWRVTQGQYYVGTDGRQVVIYRGVSGTVAGLNLSSAYTRTGIPLSEVQGSVLELPTASSTLAEAQRTVTNIRHTYACKQAEASRQKWQADKPKPKPAPSRSTGKHGKTTHGKTTRSPSKSTKAAPYPPEPTLPAFCGALGAG